MSGGTLMISRADNLFPHIHRRLEDLKFANVTVTGEERDSLDAVIREKKPDLVLMGASFYQAGTPMMAGQLIRHFPKLKIAAVAVNEFPGSIAAWFRFYGIKSYISLWDEGWEEFHRGLELVRAGYDYFSPHIQQLIDQYPEWPETGSTPTKRLFEILILLCNGYCADSIGAELHLSRQSVYNYMERLYRFFMVRNRDELVAKAWALNLVTEKDMRFLDRRKEAEALPRWAAVQQEVNRRVMKIC